MLREKTQAPPGISSLSRNLDSPTGPRMEKHSPSGAVGPRTEGAETPHFLVIYQLS